MTNLLAALREAVELQAKANLPLNDTVFLARCDLDKAARNLPLAALLAKLEELMAHVLRCNGALLVGTKLERDSLSVAGQMLFKSIDGGGA